MIMIFQIRRVKNGLVLKVLGEGKDTAENEVVYQEKYEDEVECLTDFLWYLVEEYGPSTSRYSPKRIHIETKPGDKFSE